MHLDTAMGQCGPTVSSGTAYSGSEYTTRIQAIIQGDLIQEWGKVRIGHIVQWDFVSHCDPSNKTRGLNTRVGHNDSGPLTVGHGVLLGQGDSIQQCDTVTVSFTP